MRRCMKKVGLIIFIWAFCIVNHVTVFATLRDMGVEIILSERLDMSIPSKIVKNKRGVNEHVVHTQSGKELHAELLVR